MLDKKQLRAFYKISRSNKKPEARSHQSAKAVGHLVDWLNSYEEVWLSEKNVLNIALYYPLTLELQLFQKLDGFEGLPNKATWNYLLPVITPPSNILSFHPWDLKEEEIHEGPYGIKQPKVLLEQGVIPDVVVVPMLAYGSFLERLGYGGGYYDQTFEYFENQYGKQPFKIGVCFSMHRLPDSYESQPHDYDMDIVVTDEGILDPKRKSKKLKKP